MAFCKYIPFMCRWEYLPVSYVMLKRRIHARRKCEKCGRRQVRDTYLGWLDTNSSTDKVNNEPETQV